MELREITNKEEWEEFLEGCTEKTFLQSWNWGDFNLKMGSKIWRFGVYDGPDLLAVAQVTKTSAKRGIFLFIPHGPAIKENLAGGDKKDILEILLLRLKIIAGEEGASFIRISPLFKRDEDNKNIFADLGFITAPMHASAYEATWKLDIFLPEEKLLAGMRKTTRYLIKKVAENPDISVKISQNQADIVLYQKLNREVAKRQHFVPFSDGHIKNEFEIFNNDNQTMFLFGKYKGEVVAGALIIFWGGIAFYHQAASLGKFAKLSIPYLLQWEAIKEAKRRGCKIYDFWGFTDPEKFSRHPWAGPTLFKMGFGGYKTEYVLTQDFIISQKYWLNYAIEKIRRFYRGL